MWRACGRTLFSAPLLALVLHLCVGDTWNCVTNIEQRLGVSAVGVLAVLVERRGGTHKMLLREQEKGERF